ncbi:hypothetical protein KI387_009392 [Taxus chinensis]|uniref:Nodulin-like domain-containing protein n=1 Tax=Taxus chinensis TaxID=29808 RepID=A0AA38FIZ0_TAXCH|nr:hypothetical protein KI387_009392 [Taxus chinensis]
MDFGYVRRLYKSRWLVLVAAIWMQSWAGIGYVFGSMSPVIKSSLKYNQRQINTLGVAKDIGDAFGLIGGYFSEILPSWAIMIWGALFNFVGYGSLWLLVRHKVPQIPFWAVCLLIGVGTNGETYFNTIALVSCVKNFPKSRGPVVGILKGFTGLCGAILTQYYASLFAPDQAAFIFMVAVGPSMVAFALMFILRPVGGCKETNPSDTANFNFVYGVCLVLATYLLGVMLVQDFVDIGQTVKLIFTVILLVLLISPLALPLISACTSNYPSAELDPTVKHNRLEAPLLDKISDAESGGPEQSNYGQGYQRQDSNVNWNEVLMSEIEDEKPKEIDLLPEHERQKRIAQLQARLLHAAAEGAVRIKRRKGPRRGEDFTLMQAMIKADFWLMFFSLFFGAASGLTVIDNLGQISQSMGYPNSHIFVSMISIWNFLGRVGGGFVSEIVARDHAYPRPVAMAAAQIIMAIGHIFFAIGWSGSLYIGTFLVGLGYGAHWAIIPATASEIFGLRNFGTFYNFFIMANPAGTFIFSGLIAGTLYDWEAEKQHGKPNQFSSLSVTDFGISGGPLMDKPLDCLGPSCFFLTFLIMTGVCLLAAVLSMILVYRTRIVYRNIYGKNLNSEERHLRKDGDLRGKASSSDLRPGFLKNF